MNLCIKHHLDRNDILRGFKKPPRWFWEPVSHGAYPIEMTGNEEPSDEDRFSNHTSAMYGYSFKRPGHDCGCDSHCYDNDIDDESYDTDKELWAMSVCNINFS